MSGIDTCESSAQTERDPNQIPVLAQHIENYVAGWAYSQLSQCSYTGHSHLSGGCLSDCSKKFNDTRTLCVIGDCLTCQKFPRPFRRQSVHGEHVDESLFLEASRKCHCGLGRNLRQHTAICLCGWSWMFYITSAVAHLSGLSIKGQRRRLTSFDYLFYNLGKSHQALSGARLGHRAFTSGKGFVCASAGAANSWGKQGWTGMVRCAWKESQAAGQATY